MRSNRQTIAGQIEIDLNFSLGSPTSPIRNGHIKGSKVHASRSPMILFTQHSSGSTSTLLLPIGSSIFLMAKFGKHPPLHS